MMHSRLYILLIFVFIISCKTQESNSYVPADVTVQYLKFDKKITEQTNDTEILVASYRDSMQSEMSIVIGTNAENLNKAKPNCNLGNWMCDVLKEEAELLFEREVDFAIQNYGGIRIPTLAKGDVTKSKIFELMPFDNTLILAEFDSIHVQKLCNRIADYGGWPISDGLSFKMQDSIAVDILVSGKTLKAGTKYQVALPDYIANGGDQCDFLADIKLDNSNVYIREILISNIERHTSNGEIIKADPTHRIK